MVPCLTPEQIKNLVAGTLPREQAIQAEAHLAECASCRTASDSYRREKDSSRDICQASTRNAAPGVSALVPQVDEPSLSAIETIEGFDVLREIHRGGQGVVYTAIQKATKRKVAIKVLLCGPYATARQRHRFEREIDLVASLQHPNIVTIYDSGLARGRHYFAMEYIRGLTLNAYLRDKDLPINTKLRVFQKICAAVSYAHLRGVIHRDLKPGNIIVDAKGEPHVLDFGLAKAPGVLLHDGGPVTITGEFTGTLAYASPEQTKGDPNLIDTRSDVYSLGVILFEMLTGQFPYEIAGQMCEVLRNIASAEPRRPSTICRQINDEVDTIVVKALAKDTDRRYQSAENLARDIEHYLAGEPIEAKRDSGWYVLKKTLRKYRFPTAIAAMFVLTISVAATSFYGLYRKTAIAERSERRERERANAAQKEAITERDVALKAQRDAERARAEAIAQRETLELLNATNRAYSALWKSVELDQREALLRSLTWNESNSSVAWVLLGNDMVDSTKWTEAQRAFERALTLDPRLTVAWIGSARCRLGLGQTGDAAVALREALRLEPSRDDAWYLLHETLCKMRHFSEANDLRGKAHKERPELLTHCPGCWSHKLEECTICDGTGRGRNAKICASCVGSGVRACTRCNGTGSIKVVTARGDGSRERRSEPCSACWLHGWLVCSDCMGAGMTNTCAKCGGKGTKQCELCLGSGKWEVVSASQSRFQTPTPQ